MKKATTNTKTTNTQTKELKSFTKLIEELQANRSNSRALSKSIFDKDGQATMQAWVNAVEQLRLATSELFIKGGSEDSVFNAWKVCLKMLSTQNKQLKALATDSKNFIAFIAKYRKPSKDSKQKELLPSSKIGFRSDIEKYIIDRYNNTKFMTAEQIEAERKAKREAKKAARKLAKEKANKK